MNQSICLVQSVKERFKWFTLENEPSWEKNSQYDFSWENLPLETLGNVGLRLFTVWWFIIKHLVVQCSTKPPEAYTRAVHFLLPCWQQGTFASRPRCLGFLCSFRKIFYINPYFCHLSEKLFAALSRLKPWLLTMAKQWNIFRQDFRTTWTFWNRVNKTIMHV